MEHKSRFNWNAVDWSESDTIIAKQLGCGLSCVGVNRRRLHKPPTPGPCIPVRSRQRIEQVKASPVLLTIPQISKLIKMSIGNTRRFVLHYSLSHKWGHFRYPYELMDWRLSDTDLGGIWHSLPANIGSHRPGKSVFRHSEPTDGPLRQLAIIAETAKAAAWFVVNPKPRHRLNVFQRTARRGASARKPRSAAGKDFRKKVLTTS
jgi:hypothetical protein